MKVPFNRPCVVGEEAKAVQELISRGVSLAGAGVIGKACEKLLSQKINAEVLLTTSATHALEIAALLLDIAPGDEVIVPSFTFVSSANPFVLRGAKVQFVDVDLFGNICLDSCMRAMNKKTRAVVAVHYAGNSCKIDELKKICDERNIILIEDAAQAVNSFYNNKPLGTFGHLACYSFHDTKNINCGEGGALIINDKRYLERAEILREKGTNRKQFLDGLIDKYTWVDHGSSYIISELNSSFLQVQINALDKITQKRGELWNKYYSELKGLFDSVGARVLEIPKYNKSNFHIFGVLMKSNAQRTEFIKYLRSEGISASFHYVALHSSPMGKKIGVFENTNLENSTAFSDRFVRLPLFYNLTDGEQDYVIEKVVASFL